MRNHWALRSLIGGLLGGAIGLSFGVSTSSIWELAYLRGVPLSPAEIEGYWTTGLQMGILLSIVGLVWGSVINLPFSWCKSPLFIGLWLAIAIGMISLGVAIGAEFNTLSIGGTVGFLFACLLILLGLNLILRWSVGLLALIVQAGFGRVIYITLITVLLVVLLIGFALFGGSFAYLLLPLALSLLLYWIIGLLEQVIRARWGKTAFLILCSALLMTGLAGLELSFLEFSVLGVLRHQRYQALLATEQFANEQEWQGYEMEVSSLDSVFWQVKVSFSNGDVLICEGASYHQAEVNRCEPPRP